MTRLLAFLAFGLFFYLCARLQPKDAPEPEDLSEPEQLTSELIVEDYPWPERWRCADGRGVVTMEAQIVRRGECGVPPAKT
jgi:hypothetical protein